MDIMKNFNKKVLSNKLKSEPDKGLSSHPALSAKNVWNANIAELHSKVRIWQLATFIALFITLTAVGGLIHLGAKVKFVPFVVEVNKLGETVVVKPLATGTVKDTRIIRARVAQFISDLRIVTFDKVLQRDIVYRVYSNLNRGDPAINKVNNFYNNEEMNPFELSKEFTVEIQILSLVANTESTYQVDWNEKKFNKSGVLKEIKTYRSLVTIYLVDTAVDNVDDLLKNPLGIFVKDFSISELKINE